MPNSKTDYRNIVILACALALSGCASLFRSSTSVEHVLMESASVGADLDARAGREIASVNPNAFQWPLRKMAVSSSFGVRDGRPHHGVDLRATTGTQVYAAADGVVVLAADAISGYGNTIILRHRKDYATVYGHLYDYLVEKGETVKKGQCIGYSGESGRVTGPHLHFEIREGVTAIDPVNVLRPKVDRRPAGGGNDR